MSIKLSISIFIVIIYLSTIIGIWKYIDSRINCKKKQKVTQKYIRGFSIGLLPVFFVPFQLMFFFKKKPDVIDFIMIDTITYYLGYASLLLQAIISIVRTNILKNRLNRFIERIYIITLH